MRGVLLILRFVAAVALLSGVARLVCADEIEVRDVRLDEVEEGVVLSADFAFDFSPRLAHAVASGVPLYFLVEFELTRPRWYWFDEKAAARRQHVRLSYHAISRQYRLSTGALQQSFASVGEALAVLRRLRNWLVLERGMALSDADYQAEVRLRLDLSLLPKPFQVSALTSSELRLESGWRRFEFHPSPAFFAAQPVPERGTDKPESAEKSAGPGASGEAAAR
ncbi:MAG: DUF4390 domain-containing protein [Betaproteobacteria bacterium]|nr:DUF4390 domain-containing protein [Betaproteobacteria bacterium]